MHEKDIELAKLLLGKLQELDQRRAQVNEALAHVESELEGVRKLREERSQYLDILTRAAQLLEREDLKEELPETSALEEEAEKLIGQLDEIRQVAAQYEELVEGLRERAPLLLESAGIGQPPAESVEEGPAADAGSEAGAVEEPLAEEVGAAEEAGEEPPLLEPASAEDIIAADDEVLVETPAVEAGEGPADEEQDAEAETEAQVEAPAEPAVAEPAPEEQAPPISSADAELSLKRFNVSNLKRREAFTHGRGAAYIIDASSVLERVPNYDHYVRGIEPEQAREELIRDFDVLTRELSGTFHLIFNAWFQYAAVHGNTLTVEFGTGPGEGTKEASDRRLRELVFEMTAKLRPVCIVTGDSTLADSVRGQGIHIIPLGEFFRA